MVGGGKKTGTHATTARTDSPVLRSGTKATVKKRKRVQEVIEISSSYHNNNQTRNENDENEISDDSKGYNKEESVRELRKEIKDVKDEIEEIRKTLKEIILKSAEDDKIRRSPQTPLGLPLLATNMSTPRNIDMPKTAITDTSEKNKSPGTTGETKSAPNFMIEEKKLSEHGTPRTQFVRRLFIHQGDVQNRKYGGRSKGVEIPDWYHVTYRPPKDMIIDEIDAATAAYIFMDKDGDLDHGNQIVIKSSWAKTNINVLNCLKPGKWMDEEVINQLACRLTYIQRYVIKFPCVWFLLTFFSQYVLERGTIGVSSLATYRKTFMGKFDLIRKIFVPINDENSHWYLLVVDINKRQLILLDSLPSPKRRECRRRNVKKVAMYMEDMLSDPSFYDIPRSAFPVISDFELIEPEGLTEQLPGSNDCGVWVCHWMIDCITEDEYNKINVTTQSQMRLAIDLVLHNYNHLKSEVISSAFNAWDEQRLRMKKLVKKWRTLAY